MCCWLAVPEDALVAVGGSDGVVRIVSLTRSGVERHLTGHSGRAPVHAVLELKASR